MISTVAANEQHPYFILPGSEVPDDNDDIDNPGFRAFNPWRFPASAPSVTLITHVQATCEAVEAEYGSPAQKA